MMQWCLLTLFLSGTFASKIELNETLQKWFPPLYQLEDWKSCQGIGDTYCSVEAALVSREPSALLDIMKEYSAQTLKHYNRTHIQRGMCVSRCPGGANASDVVLAAQDCLNETVHQQYQLEAVVIEKPWCSTVGASRVTTATRVMAAITAVLVILVGIATAAEKYQKKKVNRFLLAFSAINNWRILTYDRSQPRSEPRLKNLCYLEGIRVFGIEFVIFAHVMLSYVTSYIDNPEYIESMYDNIIWKIMLNTPVWLQAFFALTGFLTAYSWLIVSEKKETTVFLCFLAFINRIVRLAPLALYTLWFTMTLFPLMGSGPQWSWFVEREASDCTGRWMYYMMFMHNYLELGKFCMIHTWYVSADMQFHVFGCILMFILLRYRRAVAPILVSLVLGSAVTAGFVSYYYEITPLITGQAPENLRKLFFESNILSKLYLPMWMNIPGYVCGVGTGFLHYYNQQQDIDLSTKKWFNTLTNLSLHIVSLFLATGVVFLADDPPPMWAAAIYAAIDRTVLSILFCIFMLGLVNKCKSPMLTLFSWRGFHIFGRLSYCAYTIHFTMVRLVIAKSTQLGHASIFSMICLLVIGTVFTYIASIPLFLCVEQPCIQLWKALFQSPKPTEDSKKPKLEVSDTQTPNV